MNFICQEGKWTWQRTLDSFEFTAWYINQPDNNQGYQNCLMLSHSFGFQWDDNSCALKRSFICEKFQSMCISRFNFLTSWLINCYILIANHKWIILFVMKALYLFSLRVGRHATKTGLLMNCKLARYHNGLCQYCSILNKSGMTPWVYMSFFIIKL